jgi:hypothetical protein
MFNRQSALSGLCAVTAFSLLTCCLDAKAQSVIISPTAATATTTTPGGYGIQNTINQSGLSIGFESGITDFDLYINSGPKHTSTAKNNEWFGASSTSSDVVVYDLGTAYLVDKLALWNEESSGIGHFDLLASIDGVSYSTILAAVAPPDNPLADYGASVYAFPSVNARYFRMDLSGCPQPDPGAYNSCAIGEVAFSSVPGPLPILGAAIGFGSARRIRKRIQDAKQTS